MSWDPPYSFSIVTEQGPIVKDDQFIRYPALTYARKLGVKKIKLTKSGANLREKYGSNEESKNLVGALDLSFINKDALGLFDTEKYTEIHVITVASMLSRNKNKKYAAYFYSKLIFCKRDVDTFLYT